MIHIEWKHPDKKPLGETGKPGEIDPKRCKLLKKWSVWIKCPCNEACGSGWIFANDTGLYRGSVASRDCRLLTWQYAALIEGEFLRKDKQYFHEASRAWGQTET